MHFHTFRTKKEVAYASMHAISINRSGVTD
uniref:Uncharacterized protein n=1 Tax=Rhizophora mucronata TaxID=61149 RepID=A0A2P2NYY8_RHIMU